VPGRQSKGTCRHAVLPSSAHFTVQRRLANQNTLNLTIDLKGAPPLQRSPLGTTPPDGTPTSSSHHHIRLCWCGCVRFSLSLSLSLCITANPADVSSNPSKCLQSLNHRQTWRRKLIPFLCAPRSTPPSPPKSRRVTDHHCALRFGSALRSFWHTMTSYDRRMFVLWPPRRSL
jgi:hypothetical protein